MASKRTKIWLIVAAVFGIILVILVGIGLYVGVFSSVEISEGIKGPYNFVFVSVKGPYQLVGEKINQVESLLRENNVIYDFTAARYYDDPKLVPKEKLRSDAGAIVKNGTQTIDPLKYEQIPERFVVIAKIKAHPAIAPFKIYPEIRNYIERNNYDVIGPSFEIYHPDGVVEAQMAINPVR